MENTKNLCWRDITSIHEFTIYCLLVIYATLTYATWRKFSYTTFLAIGLPTDWLITNDFGGGSAHAYITKSVNERLTVPHWNYARHKNIAAAAPSKCVWPAELSNHCHLARKVRTASCILIIYTRRRTRHYRHILQYCKNFARVPCVVVWHKSGPHHKPNLPKHKKSKPLPLRLQDIHTDISYYDASGSMVRTNPRSRLSSLKL